MKNPHGRVISLPWGIFVRRPSGGGRIRTDDLEVMSLASYRAAPPRDMLYGLAALMPALIINSDSVPQGNESSASRQNPRNHFEEPGFDAF